MRVIGPPDKRTVGTLTGCLVGGKIRMIFLLTYRNHGEERELL